MAKDARLERFGLKAYNKPKRTPKHPSKSHVVLAKEGTGKSAKTKIIRFGQQGANTAGKPKESDSAAMRAKRRSFKARHAKNIAKGKMSGAYWANKVKWQEVIIPKGKGTYGSKTGRPKKKKMIKRTRKKK